MPKFTGQEKERIKDKLLLEGEKLFASVGLRKITIDNLSEAAGISHSAFYTFYESKEQLFMEINTRNKTEIYKKLNVLLSEKSQLPPKELAKFYILFLRKELFSDPIILSLDKSLIEYISRRVSPELIQNNTLIDQDAIEKLTKAGVKLRYSNKYTVKATEAVFVGISCLEEDEDQGAIIEILVDALIDKLVLSE
jgi:Transcriptional regulator